MGRNEAIARRVKVLCGKYGTRDPFTLAEEMGIQTVIAHTLHRLKGMYTVIKRNRIIILNAKESDPMRRIVCAHELGHDQLHRAFAREQAMREFALYDTSSIREYEANIFAAELLLEDETVLEMIESGMNTAQIAAATESDINLVALKADSLIARGYPLHGQEHNSKFLK